MTDFVSHPVDTSQPKGRTELQKQMKQFADVVSIEFFVASNMSKSFEASTGSDLAQDVERFLMTLMYWPADKSGSIGYNMTSVTMTGVEGAFGSGGKGSYKLPEPHPILRLPKQFFGPGVAGSSVDESKVASKVEQSGVLPQIISIALPDGGKCWISPFQVQVDVVSFDTKSQPYLVKVRLDGMSHREWQVLQ